MAKTIVYIFICCCGVVTVYTLLGYVLNRMNADTLIGMAMGVLMALGIVAGFEALKRRGWGFSEQVDSPPKLPHS